MRRRRVPDHSWAAEPDPLLALAQRELAFYARACDRARRLHHVTELGALLSTSVTVVAAGLHAPAWLTALIAGGAVFFTGMRQLYGAGSRWVLAAQAREALRRALDRYLLLSPAERDEAARQALQSVVEEVGANELRTWAETQGGRPEAAPLPPVQT
ncbi:DUF4231 domain-containing protein [Streptomyces collinus]|uniref:SMODS and SLOG-associating 2TM effector domain-containing protein n=1 Tax=Streptomyces collinus (strain DSM 40733 / Tue 365) TaxID=1214242 RepID=S5VYT4_STRC3|nr:DUF4231 domain-containing protein [Streptomyces collinus]AGS73170.1 hypothetical protein B446_31830 [Streptomyces collinus Tu 365]UJA11837.1 hypothetical protein HGI10_58180 [Streptomyces collinus]UJA13297.1 hypothetical protein HGI09_05920 [Streptomyces collinus]